MADLLEEELSSGPNLDSIDSDDEQQPQSGGAGGEDDDQPASSALRENIRTKGSNSYYYAHKTKIDAPAWDGNEAPRLLAREVKAGSEQPTVIHEAITKYAWSDESEKVKIYITLEEAQLKEEDVSLDWTASSMTLVVKGDEASRDKGRVLQLAKLYDEIEGATYRVKSDRITLTLKKKSKTSWFDLKKDA